MIKIKKMIFVLALLFMLMPMNAQATTENPEKIINDDIPETEKNQEYFHVVFMADNKVIFEKEIKSGEMLLEIPTAPKLSNKSFVNWMPNPKAPIKNDTVFTAIYEDMPQKKYYVSFIADGKILWEGDVEERENAIPPDYRMIPVPEGEVFIGWNPDTRYPITKNTTYIAQYRKNTQGNDDELYSNPAYEKERTEISWMIEILSSKKQNSKMIQAVISMANKTLANKKTTLRELDEISSMLETALNSTEEDETLILNAVNEGDTSITGETVKNAEITVKRNNEILAKGSSDKSGKFEILIPEVKKGEVLTVIASFEVENLRSSNNRINKWFNLIGNEKREISESITVKESEKEKDVNEFGKFSKGSLSESFSISYKAGYSTEVEIRNGMLIEKKLDITIPKRNGIPLIPVRNVANHYGINVRYDMNSRKIILFKNLQIVSLNIDNGLAMDSTGQTMSTEKPVIINGRTFLNPGTLAYILGLSQEQLVLDGDMVLFIIK